MRAEIRVKDRGLIVLDLTHDKTPVTVANFVALVERKFYDGLKFHRVVDNFMIQAGCPFGKGNGGPGYQFKDEGKWLKHARPGMLSMANSGPNTNGSQFFITHVPTPWLDGKHTVFGSVVEGMDVVNSVKQDDEIETIVVSAEPEELDVIMNPLNTFRKTLEEIHERRV